MDDSHEELLAVTRYAEVLAHVIHFGPDHEAEVCRRLEVDEEVWRRSQAHWQPTLAADALSPQAEHAPAFARFFGEIQQRLAEESPSLDEVGALVESAVEDAPPREDAPATSAAEEPAPAAPAPPPVATPPLATPAPAAPPPAAAPAPPPVAPPTAARPAAASPWADTAEPSSPIQPLGAHDAPTQGTAIIDPNALAAVLAATPFSGESSAPAPAAPALDDDVVTGETGFIDPVAVARAATPFMHGAPPPGPTTPSPADAPPAPAPPAAVPPAPAGEPPALADNPDATAFVDLAALGTADLPFADAPAVAPPSALTAEDQASFGETGLIDPAQFAHLAIPFDQEPEAESASLGALDDLQQYASYCVELVAYPGHEETIRGRYGVTSPEHHHRVAATWSTRFGADAALQQRFQQAIETYRAWLASQKR